MNCVARANCSNQRSRMYNAFQHGCERLLRIPPDPRPPPGDETSTRIFRAAPNFFKYLFVIWALSTLGIFANVVVSIVGPLIGAVDLLKEGKPWGWALMPVPLVVFAIFSLVSLFRLAVVRLDYEKRWYIVTDRSLRVREGVIGVQEMTVTFANIQNISIAQGPIQRALGIADLRVDTAGGAGAASHSHYAAAQTAHVAWFRGIDN